MDWLRQLLFNLVFRQNSTARRISFLHRLLFEIWYFRNPPWDTGISPPELMAFIQSNPPGRALDLGCGTGTNVITLAKHGWQACGVDFASKAIERAQRKAREARVRVDLQVDDVTRLEGVTGTFELILDMGCFHNLSQTARKDYIRTIDRLLAENGTYLLYAFFKSGAETGPGLVEEDLNELSTYLKLMERKNGSERGARPSAWLTYRRKKPSSSTGHQGLET